MGVNIFELDNILQFDVMKFFIISIILLKYTMASYF